MTTDRKAGTLHLARQIFKYDGTIYLRIFASARPLPKRLEQNDAIYHLSMETSPGNNTGIPYRTCINGWYIREFPSWERAHRYLLERIFTVSRQFGFRPCLIPYDWSI